MEKVLGVNAAPFAVFGAPETSVADATGEFSTANSANGTNGTARLSLALQYGFMAVRQILEGKAVLRRLPNAERRPHKAQKAQGGSSEVLKCGNFFILDF